MDKIIIVFGVCFSGVVSFALSTTEDVTDSNFHLFKIYHAMANGILPTTQTVHGS